MLYIDNGMREMKGFRMNIEGKLKITLELLKRRLYNENVRMDVLFKCDHQKGHGELRIGNDLL